MHNYEQFMFDMFILLKSFRKLFSGDIKEKQWDILLTESRK
jgi:hypothetical protein